MRIDNSVSRGSIHYLLAAGSVFAAGGVFYLFRDYLDRKHDESLLFLPVVIACAIRLGFGPAVTASLLAVAIWDFFFIPPTFTLTVGRPGDGIDLIAFLVAAITTSQLAAQARRTAETAELREREIATLYNVGEIVSSEIESDRILYTLADQIAQVCAATRCLVFRVGQDGLAVHLAAGSTVAAVEALTDSDFDRETHKCAESIVAETRNTSLSRNPGARRPVDSDRQLSDPSDAIVIPAGPAAGSYLPLHDGDATVGVLFVGPRVDNRTRESYDNRLLAALGNYAASVIARQDLADQSRRRVHNTAIFEERNRLAREIHDTLAQGLTGIVIHLQAADGGSPADQWAAVTQAKRLAEECLTEARRSVKALRPGALETRDLPSALSEMLVQTTRATRIDGFFRTFGTPFALPGEIDAHLLRIGQEAVTNTLRHGRASRIQITLSYEATVVELRIVDDGRGFVPDSDNRQGFGLVGMRERASQFGASLEISSAPKAGTSIAVTIPVAKPADTGARGVRPDEKVGIIT